MRNRPALRASRWATASGRCSPGSWDARTRPWAGWRSTGSGATSSRVATRAVRSRCTRRWPSCLRRFVVTSFAHSEADTNVYAQHLITHLKLTGATAEPRPEHLRQRRLEQVGGDRIRGRQRPHLGDRHRSDLPGRLRARLAAEGWLHRRSGAVRDLLLRPCRLRGALRRRSRGPEHPRSASGGSCVARRIDRLLALGSSVPAAQEGRAPRAHARRPAGDGRRRRVHCGVAALPGRDHECGRPRVRLVRSRRHAHRLRLHHDHALARLCRVLARLGRLARGERARPTAPADGGRRARGAELSPFASRGSEDAGPRARRCASRPGTRRRSSRPCSR